MKKRVRISLSQKLLIVDELKKHCTKDADGFAVWEAKWSDERVAAVCGDPINDIHVRNVRRELIGNQRRGPTNDGTTSARLEAIEDYLTSKYPGWREEMKAAA